MQRKIPEDGSMNAATIQAIADFQKLKKLPADGEIAPKGPTITALLLTAKEAVSDKSSCRTWYVESFASPDLVAEARKHPQWNTDPLFIINAYLMIVSKQSIEREYQDLSLLSVGEREHFFYDGSSIVSRIRRLSHNIAIGWSQYRMQCAYSQKVPEGFYGLLKADTEEETLIREIRLPVETEKRHFTWCDTIEEKLVAVPIDEETQSLCTQAWIQQRMLSGLSPMPSIFPRGFAITDSCTQPHARGLIVDSEFFELLHRLTEATHHQCLLTLTVKYPKVPGGVASQKKYHKRPSQTEERKTLATTNLRTMEDAFKPHAHSESRTALRFP
jgi:hypothetical protein